MISAHKHFIIHTQYYPPEIGAPQSRLSELAEGLAKSGFEVTILTAMPSYPLGKIFKGYGGWWRKETQNGITIFRSFIYPTQSTRLFPRLLNYFSFVFSSFLAGLLFIRRVDFLLTESPPLFLGISGYLLSRLTGARWIFNVSDLWPESAVRLGIISDGIPLKLSTALEKSCYQKAWLVTGQSKSILQNITNRFPEVHTYHLSNGVNTDLFTPTPMDLNIRQLIAPNGEIVLFYGGLHGLAQGLDQVLISAKQIQDTCDLNVCFVFVGDGPEKKKLTRLAEELALRNVLFLPPVEKQKMPDFLSSADIVLVPLKMYLPGAVPSKLYEAMACGKPVILVAEGEAAEIVKSSQAGLVVKPGDINAQTQAIMALVSDYTMRQNFGYAGRKAALDNYDRTKIVEQFAGLLNYGTIPQ